MDPRVIELVQKLQEIAHETGWSTYVDASLHGRPSVHAIRSIVISSYDSIGIKGDVQEYEVDGVKVKEFTIKYIPQSEFDPVKHTMI